MLRLFYGYQLKNIRCLNGSFELIGLCDETLVISRLVRLPKYREGISSRILNLQAQYLTAALEFGVDECVVDVGANIGEFGKFWSSRSYSVYAFEPDPTEFNALAENLKGQSIYNCGLWNESTTLTFYSANDSGDSSIIEPGFYTSKIELRVTRIDDIEIPSDVGLLKIEAEGAEPEILEGAVNTLKKTRYVTVDVGEERGVAAESTLVDVCNIMYSSGFELLDFNPKRLVVLFRNMSLTKLSN